MRGTVLRVVWTMRRCWGDTQCDLEAVEEDAHVSTQSLTTEKSQNAGRSLWLPQDRCAQHELHNSIEFGAHRGEDGLTCRICWEGGGKILQFWARDSYMTCLFWPSKEKWKDDRKQNHHKQLTLNYPPYKGWSNSTQRGLRSPGTAPSPHKTDEKNRWMIT